MKKFIIGLIVVLIILGIGIGGFVFYNKKNELKVSFNNDLVLEINTEHKLEELLKDITNGNLKDKDRELKTDSLGEHKEKVLIVTKNKKEKDFEVGYKVVDTKNPIISNTKEKITITEGDKVDLLKDVKVEDNSNEELKVVVEGDYDLKKAGTYKLKYVAKDLSGNETSVDFELIVKEKKVVVSNPTPTVNKKSNYYIKVNKTQNVVMVYTKDDAGQYTKLVKTMVCSAGNKTPVGTFQASGKAETLALVGNVWGHYTMRIKGPYWFHSVPYYSKPSKGEDGKLHWNDLEYEEYNKLGNLASKGCIRLAVIDSKWIYDNIPNGTTVEIYESDTLPEGVSKPSAIKIDVNSEFRGWDPTDPDPQNPWHK